MKKSIFVMGLFVLCHCTESRVRRYESLLAPMVGTGKKEDVRKTLGSPVSCKPATGAEVCEYRTAAGRNVATPEIHRRVPGMGPDVSPYENFDVLHLYFDDLGILKEWQPIVIRP